MAPSPSDIALHIRKSASVRSSPNYNYNYNSKSTSSSPSTTSLSSVGKTTTPALSHTPSKSRTSSTYAPSSLASGSHAQLALAHLKALKKDNGLMTLRYEEAVSAKPPIPVTVAPPRKPPTDLHPALRVRTEEQDVEKRDSGLANTTASGSLRGEGSVNTDIATGCEGEEGYNSGLTIDFDCGSEVPVPLREELKEAPRTPTREDSSHKVATPPGSLGSRTGSMRQWVRTRGSRKGKENAIDTPNTQRSRAEEPQIEEGQEHLPDSAAEPEHFSPLNTPIPSSGLLEEDFLNTMSFSKRGSMMFGGEKAVNGHLRYGGGRRKQSISMLAKATASVLSEDAEIESQKVRSMYEQGSAPLWEDGQYSSMAQRMETSEASDDPFVSSRLLNPNPAERPDSTLSFKREHELAGGIEDWEDVNGRDVDRYGFISKPRSDRPGTPEYRPPQRVSTVLHLASETPRKKRGFGRSASTAVSPNNSRAPDRKISARSLNTQGSTTSQRSLGRVRSMTNRLPGNSDRRWVDEAGDMLTLPPGLADIAEDEEGGRAVEGMKKKEWERAEKWRKMAKVNKAGKDGEGMEFEFDARNPKLIERTWKGIPDRWRAAAWYSFLASSAKKRKDSPTEKDIIMDFHRLLKISSADDQQIDTDVPRTINSHIMFRKRYRGGQRLLFRVLHCLSLYFPDTGYVQGMASLAATLLCYYDEEKTFIMLVRMWTLRGLAQLYAAGFGGLMSALEEFRGKWMKGREVAQKLDELSIEPTSYGTRWYLTLFGYSIPFPAQLRVWDVFMLLGDSDPLPYASHPSQTAKPAGAASGELEVPVDFRGGLDILHATSAALIDGTREILLDSDFENAMKVLTSWIPVKDEELLMKVAKAEWKLVRGKTQRR